MIFGAKPYGNIVTDGLVLNLDATNPQSYPGTGTTWFDRSGYSNNGTLTNGPTYLQERGRSSIVFDGVDDYVVGTIPSISGSAFTLEAWIKPNNVTTKTYLSIGSSAATNQLVVLRLVSSTSMRFALYSDDLDVTGMNNLLDVWNCVTCTLDNSKLQSVYQNGILRGTRTSNDFYKGSTTYTVGRWPPVYLVEPFSGSVSNVKIYNRALSAQEVLQNYNALKSRFV